MSIAFGPRSAAGSAAPRVGAQLEKGAKVPRTLKVHPEGTVTGGTSTKGGFYIDVTAATNALIHGDNTIENFVVEDLQKLWQWPPDPRELSVVEMGAYMEAFLKTFEPADGGAPTGKLKWSDFKSLVAVQTEQTGSSAENIKKAIQKIVRTYTGVRKPAIDADEEPRPQGAAGSAVQLNSEQRRKAKRAGERQQAAAAPAATSEFDAGKAPARGSASGASPEIGTRTTRRDALLKQAANSPADPTAKRDSLAGSGPAAEAGTPVIAGTPAGAASEAEPPKPFDAVGAQLDVLESKVAKLEEKLKKVADEKDVVQAAASAAIADKDAQIGDLDAKLAAVQSAAARCDVDRGALKMQAEECEKRAFAAHEISAIAARFHKLNETLDSLAS